ncbi:EF-P 5-aminopentanol modification-associated protein YfmF [Xylanivirga thermophila]|jgi:predicted Zn-dependent peptidase|uniref:EF-P 5-aminopentanol modification-associated protein YfmF n=1 Tax=Xylanivirga thermophila TaxID=2496273 RepID=UPI00101C9E89|nr:pitrilysin family protein [Xylanivirga thermophila]
MIQIEKIGLGDGIDVYIIPSEKFKTVDISYCFHCDLDNMYTYNALIPAVLKRGCEGLETMKDIESYLEGQYGAIFNVGVQKKGERQILRFSMEVINDNYLPDEQTAVLAQAFHFLNRVITKPVLENGAFKKSYVEQEKENLKNRIQAIINDKMLYSMERCVQIMCKDEKYSRYTFGSVNDLKDIDSSNLYDVYKDIISRSPLDIFVVGNVDREKIIALIKNSLNIERRSIKNIPKTSIKKIGITPNYMTEELDVSQGKLNMGFRVNTSFAEKEHFPLVVYTSILGGGPHSKLFLNVREKASLAYYAFARLESLKGLMLVGSGIEMDKYNATLDIILKQVEEMKNGNISQMELDSAKNAIITSIKGIQDQPGQLIDYYLRNIVGERDILLDEYIENIQEVTIENVVDVSKRVKLDTVYFLTGKGKGVLK